VDRPGRSASRPISDAPPTSKDTINNLGDQSSPPRDRLPTTLKTQRPPCNSLAHRVKQLRKRSRLPAALVNVKTLLDAAATVPVEHVAGSRQDAPSTARSGSLSRRGFRASTSHPARPVDTQTPRVTKRDACRRCHLRSRADASTQQNGAARTGTRAALGWINFGCSSEPAPPANSHASHAPDRPEEAGRQIAAGCSGRRRNCKAARPMPEPVREDPAAARSPLLVQGGGISGQDGPVSSPKGLDGQGRPTPWASDAESNPARAGQGNSAERYIY